MRHAGDDAYVLKFKVFSFPQGGRRPFFKTELLSSFTRAACLYT